jgi:hypothetical protein
MFFFINSIYGDNANNIAILIDELRTKPNDPVVLDKAVNDLASNFYYSELIDENAKVWNLKLQSEIINNSNHAQIYIDQIESMYVPDENGRIVCNQKISRRQLFYEKLNHIPSPQIVQMLGQYLFDERDKSSDDRFGASSNADFACGALVQIGLRNPPVPRLTGMLPVEAGFLKKDIWQLWYEQVKAGTRSFSFEGQDVEYRFKKDGTWITTPLTNHDPAVAHHKNEPSPNSQPISRSQSQWYWIAGILLIIVSGVAWLKRTKLTA